MKRFCVLLLGLLIGILSIAVLETFAANKTEMVESLDQFILTLTDPTDVKEWTEVRDLVAQVDPSLFEEAEPEAEIAEPMVMMSGPVNCPVPSRVKMRFASGIYTGNAISLIIMHGLDIVPTYIEVIQIDKGLSNYPRSGGKWIDMDPDPGTIVNCFMPYDVAEGLIGFDSPVYDVNFQQFCVKNVSADDYDLCINEATYYWEAVAYEYQCLEADYNQDGIVNLGDFSILAAEWLMEE